MSKKLETIADREYSSTWTGRSLDNYKAMHRKNCPDVMSARSLTEARSIVFGAKTKKVGVCGCKQSTCGRYGKGKSSHC